MMVKQQVNAATLAGRDIALAGVIMGGGPSCRAVKDHLSKGLRIFSTPEAAKTFDDDLSKTVAMGITLVSEDEINQLSSDIQRIEMRDLDFQRIQSAFLHFGVSLTELTAIAVAVFDHGNAPRNESDRIFRFKYLDQRIREKNNLSAFAYSRENIPLIMTRLQSVADSAKNLFLPLVVMDTSPAAILGATYDTAFTTRDRMMIANIGNGHTLVFRLGPGGIEGVLEHHTGILNLSTLDKYLFEFSAGTLINGQVFSDNGHGSLIYTQDPLPMNNPDFNFLVTGPRRNLVKDSRYRPHFAVPFGDMMLSGCFGLLSAVADLFPDFYDEIHKSMTSSKIGS